MKTIALNYREIEIGKKRRIEIEKEKEGTID